jgi:adenosylcobalamin-dependent ribonucleoside-triphosphate reductase
MGDEKKKKSPYWIVHDGRKYIFEQKMLYEQLTDKELQKGEILHHRDKKGLNNNIDLQNPALMKKYKRFIKRKKKTDLDLLFDEGTYVIKECEVCGKNFKVKWGKREQSYCSYECSNNIAARKAGRASESYKSKNIPSRKLGNDHHNKKLVSSLKDMALCYNHKVVSVKKIGTDTVYNGTVDEFHNYGIVLNEKKTKSNRPKLEMVFTANCGEQTLESFELCCLAETFPSRHESFEEYRESLKYAYLYAKSVTLVNTHWKETNAVMLKNRRMGISQTGITEAFVKHGRRKVLEWCDKGYEYLQELDEEYSSWLCVPQSIKLTTVKPSGTVSILAGVTSGIHYPHSEYYIRRVRVSSNSDLIPLLEDANYRIEEDQYSNNTMVIEFPCHCENFSRGKEDVSIWEQAENAAAYQKYWSDNQVSITVTFKPEETDEIEHVLECFEDKLKAISFLPIKEHGYEQAPYEEITKEEYEERVAELKPLKLSETVDEAIGEKFCDSDTCKVDYDVKQNN